MNNSISKVTESEFLTFVSKIYNDEYDTEGEHDNAVLEFKALAGHPAGSDLLFYPEAGKSGPQAVVAEVKAWRTANGKPSFKPS